jgi:phosphogluconate dehydratase
MLMEMMGLHLPGSAFVNPGTPLRDALTVAATERALRDHRAGRRLHADRPHIDEKAIVNAMVGLAATGGSTNHAIHLVAIARAAGIASTGTTGRTLARHAAAGARLSERQRRREPLPRRRRHGLRDPRVARCRPAARDIRCVHGGDLRGQAQEPWLDELALRWRDRRRTRSTAALLRGVPTVRSRRRPAPRRQSRPRGGQDLGGGTGASRASRRRRASSTRRTRCWRRSRPARSIGDFRRRGARPGPARQRHARAAQAHADAGVLQDRGQRVALLTDGRMSGASGKVLAAIHVTPEAACGGAIAKLRDGDLVRIDADAGTLEALVDAAEWAARDARFDLPQPAGRASAANCSAMMRANAGTAEQGACSAVRGKDA